MNGMVYHGNILLPYICITLLVIAGIFYFKQKKSEKVGDLSRSKKMRKLLGISLVLAIFLPIVFFLVVSVNGYIENKKIVSEMSSLDFPLYKPTKFIQDSKLHPDYYRVIRKGEGFKIEFRLPGFDNAITGSHSIDVIQKKMISKDSFCEYSSYESTASKFTIHSLEDCEETMQLSTGEVLCKYKYSNSYCFVKEGTSIDIRSYGDVLSYYGYDIKTFAESFEKID